MQAALCESRTLFSFEGAEHRVGVNDGEGPPVPIPNTEVKLTGAENTCLATDWEDRSMPTHRARKYPGSFHFHFIVGAFGGEGPPVPIPNTEVKLASAEDTWLETARKNR